MVRSTKLRNLLPVFIPALALIIFTDAHLRKMERFEELVAKGQGINSPLADFLHRQFGSTLAVKQIHEDLEFEIEPVRRLKLWSDLVDATKSQENTKGTIEACSSWIKEYPNDPRTLRAYEEVIQLFGTQHQTDRIQPFLQGWEDALIAMGPEAKLSEMLKWWEFALAYPQMTDETPIFERICHDYPKHAPSLGVMKSLEAVYLKQGKMKEAALLQSQIKTIEDRASLIQQSQSAQQVMTFLLNQRMWDQLQQQLIFICDRFPTSINFDNLLKQTATQSAAVLGSDKQLDFYRQTIEQAVVRIPATRQAGNIPLTALAGDYGMLLWNRDRFDEATKVAKILRTVGPTTPNAYQLERLLWLRDPATPIRVPHATITPTSSPPQIDGLQSDLCWFGNDHRLGELKPVAGAEPHETQIWATYDQDYFYFFAKCQEPNVDKLSRQNPQQSVWMTDCIETFFNPKRDYTVYKQFVGSALGKTNSFQFMIHDDNVKNASLDPQPWEAKTVTAVNISTDSWTYEMKIPWSTIDIKPKSGESFFFNARRFRYNGGQQFIYSWSPVQSSAHEVETFGILQLK